MELNNGTTERILELTPSSMLPCTYLVIAGLVYLLIIIFMFYSKRKVRTVENICYGTTLWLTFSTAVEEILRFTLPIYIHSNMFMEILNKLHLILIIFLVCTITMYVMVITSKRYQGRVDFKNNKYNNYYKKWFYVILAIGFVASGIAIFTDLKDLKTPAEFTSTTGYRNLLYFIVLAILIWIILMFKNFNKESRKRYLTIYGLIALLLIGIGIHWFFEYYHAKLFMGLSNITAAFIVCEIFMYFTMENPDIEVINQLNIAKEDASKANAEKTKFLSTMSHEIRTPLNAIMGFSQSLVEDETINENAKEELNDIIMSSESLLGIVNGILDISKIEEDIIEITPYEYSLPKLTNEVISLAKSRLDASSKPIEFESYVDEKIPPVLKGDAGKIKEIIINFLTNAIKYTDKGKVKFNVTGEIKGNYCTLKVSVSDTGMGIKEEDINKLFTKFQRFDLEKNNSVEGTGLGLSITKKMVELMNGKVDVQSVYGQGSTFSMTVDQEIINKQSLENDENLSSKPFDASGQTVIVVDNNKINLKVAKKELSKYKVNVETYKNHDEFIESIKNGTRCNVILLDDGMPEETKVLNELKKIPGFNIPVVAYTANAINGIRDKYIEVGYNEYLSKPVDKKELRRVLKMYLDENGGMTNQVQPTTTEVPMQPTVQATVPQQPVEVPTVQPTVEVTATPVVEQPAVAPVAPVVEQPVVQEVAPTVEEPMVPPVPIVPQQPVEVPTVQPTVEVTAAPAVEQPAVAPVTPVVEPSAAPVATPAVSSVAPSHTREYLEANKCNVNMALESLGDMDTYDIAAEEFVAEFENNMGKIKTAKEAGDMTNYAVETHGLKSNARYMGFEELGNMSYDHELAGKENNVDFVNNNYDALMSEANRVYGVLKNYMEN